MLHDSSNQTKLQNDRVADATWSLVTYVKLLKTKGNNVLSHFSLSVRFPPILNLNDLNGISFSAFPFLFLSLSAFPFLFFSFLFPFRPRISPLSWPQQQQLCEGVHGRRPVASLQFQSVSCIICIQLSVKTCVPSDFAG